MASAPPSLANPNFPNVPASPGVPNVNRTQAPFPDIVVVARRKDGTSVSKTTRTQWGIYTTKGALALKPDSFVELEGVKDYRVPTYPVEPPSASRVGGFQSYNKVEMPGEFHVTLSKGGHKSDRQAFLAAVDKILGSVSYFTIVTPEATYKNVNIVHRDLRRAVEAGATLLQVRLGFNEIRVSATVAFSNVKNAASSLNASQGSVQPQAPTPAQTPTGAPQ
jgi:hypothetical protein